MSKQKHYYVKWQTAIRRRNIVTLMSGTKNRDRAYLQSEKGRVTGKNILNEEVRLPEPAKTRTLKIRYTYTDNTTEETRFHNTKSCETR